MGTTAWKVLQQEWKLSPEAEKVLTVLLTETPVALRGDEAMAPLSKLLPKVVPRMQSAQAIMHAKNLERTQQLWLHDLLHQSWRMDSPNGMSIAFPFVKDWTLVSDSQFLRYRLDSNLLSVLEAIRRQYGLSALA